jgi:prophage antirepressor-like protein
VSDILAIAFEGHPIRTTNEEPKRISVIDVLAAVGYGNPRQKWSEVSDQFPEVVRSSDNLTFQGRGQRPTPVIDKEGALRLVMLLEGPKAAAFRQWASSILVRYLDGDRSLAQEIHLRADIMEEDEESFEPALPSEIFAEAAPAVMMALSERASRGSIQAARLLLQYHTAIKGPATIAESKPAPKAPPLPVASENWEENLTPLQQFWLNCLRTGELTPRHNFNDAVPSSELFKAYAKAAELPMSSRSSAGSFGINLRKLCPVVRHRKSPSENGRSWFYKFPSLAECRRLFCVAMDINIAWEVSNG